jgi:glucuronate isomerase
MSADLLFPAEPSSRAIARELFAHARHQPLICPHGHIDPVVLADDAPFPDPARLLIVPDHYLTRMLLSQGVPPTRLGVAIDQSGSAGSGLPGAPAQAGNAEVAAETDGRTIWRTFAAHWHLFRGTPSRLWLERTFIDVFGVDTRLSPETADDMYDALAERLATPEFRPRALFERFGIEVLATTESPLDDLAAHAALGADGWSGPGGRVITTFRPDDVVEMGWAGWPERVARLGDIAGEDTSTYAGYLTALRRRREEFVKAGATSSDHGHLTARAADLDQADAAAIFQRGLSGEATATDADVFAGHMLMEFARMSVDDGMVMQLHPGSVRNHNRWLHDAHGRDVGGDIPQATEYVHGLRPLLDAFGNDPRLTLVLYTLDETTFSRELAPLAGGYPAVYIGAPWWFLDAPEALRRFRESVTETAGFYNTAGFVDDTRAFCSIPVRHEVARRVDASYLARLVAEQRLLLDEAAETMVDLAYRLPKKIFKLDSTQLDDTQRAPRAREGHT